MKRFFDILFPLLLGVAVLALWEWIVAAKQIPPYVLPAPNAIMAALTAGVVAPIGSENEIAIRATGKSVWWMRMISSSYLPF